MNGSEFIEFLAQGDLNAAIKAIPDDPVIFELHDDSWQSGNQKAFHKVRLQCRKVSIALLCVGKLIPNLRNVLAIIARSVWGARGYCKMEIIKVKRFRVSSPPRSGGDSGGK